MYEKLVSSELRSSGRAVTYVPGAMPTGEIALLDQAADGFPDGRPADPELLGQGVLVGELVARWPGAGDDRPAQPVADHVGQQRPARPRRATVMPRSPLVIATPATAASPATAALGPLRRWPRRYTTPARTMARMVTASSTEAMALTSGLTPRRIEANR